MPALSVPVHPEPFDCTQDRLVEGWTQLSPFDGLRTDGIAGKAAGVTGKEVGRELGMASSTVSNRMYRIYRKLGVTSRASLAKLVHGD